MPKRSLKAMSETTHTRQTRTPAGLYAGNREAAGGEYYRAYYRALVSNGASRAGRNRRLEEIKAGRRRARREKWLKGSRSLASVLVNSEALS
jgi:hypothetical protein